MRRKFDRARRSPDAAMTLEPDFEVEHYLDHQGESFVARFDALSYLYLTRTMDYFDPFSDPGLDLSDVTTRFLVVSFDSDWRFATEQSVAITQALRAGGVDAQHVEIASPWGHDSFLLELPAYHRAVARFLAKASASG
jgi:homoserine O-acetyltransferase